MNHQADRPPSQPPLSAKQGRVAGIAVLGAVLIVTALFWGSPAYDQLGGSDWFASLCSAMGFIAATMQIIALFLGPGDGDV